MLCFNVKRKLYEHLEGDLSGPAAEKLKGHLQACPRCARKRDALKLLMEAASQSKAPEPSKDFWAAFDRGLSKKLPEKELPREVRFRPARSPRPSLRPAFVLATIAVFLVALSFYLFGGFPTKGRLIALNDERLIDDIEMVEEMSGEPVNGEPEDLLLDELLLLEEMAEIS